MAVRRFSAGFVGLVGLVALGACAAPDEAPTEAPGTSEDALAARADDAWFYGGPLPQLGSPVATVSLKGHTVRVTGTVPEGTTLPDLPHLRSHVEGGLTVVDLVYPIATARPGKTNAPPGSYTMTDAKPYRPHGPAFTEAEGWHDVPWGGFPFLPYDGGIALHGPITDRDNKGGPDQSVWILDRGTVSGGCNRMMGEHVVEVAHLLGVNMRRVYAANGFVSVASRPRVRVVADYDTFGGKYVDVDFPTGTGAVRPATVYGRDKVEMFGSWVASETPDGRDLPGDMKWQGGVSGAWYVFADHARADMVCAVPKGELRALKTFAARYGGELPASFCARKACVLDQLRAGRDASTCL